MKSMNEEGVIVDGIVGKHYYNQSSVAVERKGLLDVDRAHNISVSEHSK